MPSRKAEAEWKGNLIQGSGQLTVGSGVFRGVIGLGDVQRSLAFRLARFLTSRSH